MEFNAIHDVYEELLDNPRYISVLHLAYASASFLIA